MPNFFLDDPLTVGTLVPFPKEAAHHAQKVLRLKDKETINAWNGDGHYRSAQLVFEEKSVSALIVNELPKTAMEKTQVEIIQALPEGDKMDWIIEKACESGAVGIWPVQAKRSVVKLSGERLEKRHQHWYKVAIAACSQSGRAQLPDLKKTTPLLETLRQIKILHSDSVLWWLSPRGEEFAHTCFFNHRESRSANEDAPPPLRIVIAIGPEGGWDPTEEQMAVEAGFMPVKLATATLRTETAALFAIAQIQAWSVLAEAPKQG